MQTAAPVDEVRLSKGPKFGCRLFGFMSVKPSAEQGEMLYQMLQESDNSVSKQSQFGPNDTIVPRNWEGYITESYVKGNYATGVNDNGFGHVRYEHEPGKPGLQVTRYKSVHPAYTDDTLKAGFERMRKDVPAAYLLQIREASSTTGPVVVKEENNQPFTLDAARNVSFLHNGTLAANTVFWLEKQVEKAHHKYPDEIPLPKGTADSERLFLYLMSRIREEAGTVETSKIPTQKLEDIFHTALQRVDWLNHQPGADFGIDLGPRLAATTGLKVSKDSQIGFPYGLTVIFTDGDRTLLCRSNRSLNVSTMTGDDGKAKAAFVSTYEIQPQKASGLAPRQWWEVPERHIVTLERNDAEETINYKLRPLAGPVKNRLSMALWKLSVKAQGLKPD